MDEVVIPPFHGSFVRAAFSMQLASWSGAARPTTATEDGAGAALGVADGDGVVLGSDFEQATCVQVRRKRPALSRVSIMDAYKG